MTQKPGGAGVTAVPAGGDGAEDVGSVHRLPVGEAGEPLLRGWSAHFPLEQTQHIGREGHTVLHGTAPETIVQIWRHVADLDGRHGCPPYMPSACGWVESVSIFAHAGSRSRIRWLITVVMPSPRMLTP